MKKIIAIACVAWMALTGIYAGNISVEDVQMQAGETKTVSISLTNTETNLVGFQMDLTLPEGISINKAECSLGSRIVDPDQVLTIGKQGDNVYRLTSTSLALTPISGTSGTLLTLSLTAADDSQGGTATLSDIRFATSNSERVTMSDTSFNIIGKTEQTLSQESLPEMTYGDAAYTLPATTEEGLTLTWTSDNAAVASISGNTLTVGNAGTATIMATQAGNDSYLPFSREFSLTVGKAALTITANDCSKMEGEANPELTVSYEGFKNGDTEAVLTQQPAVTTTATTDSPAGTYPITASGAQAANYEISYISGTMTVEKRHIIFADTNVKAICVQNWDTDGDGELSMDEAAAVTDLGTVFKQTGIISFDELQYFTGLTNIGESTFYNCSRLTSVNIPESVTSIGNGAFQYCWILTSVTIPNSVTSIGNYAFSGCRGLTEVAIPNSVTSLGECPFYNCSSLTSVTIPNSVTSIDFGVSDGCSSLTSIVVEDGNTFYDSRDNCNAIIETSTNILIQGCKNTTIPNSVTSIGNYAFNECSGLISVTIPNSVTSIGTGAFRLCPDLTSVTIGNSVTSIGNYAFMESGLTSISIPNSVTSIGESAFYGCSGLTSVTIPNSVTSIGESAFYGCSGLTSINIPNSVTSIGSKAFFYCSDLTEVTIPNSVTSIGGYAFYGCSGLTSVKVGMETPLSISSSTFSNRANAILYVPRGSKEAYETADYWKEFKEIVEYGGIEQTLALETLPSMTYGDDAYTLPDTTAEGLTLIWNSDNTSVATVSGNVLAINGAGTATITATQAGNDSYLPFSREFSLTVGKAVLTITANDCSKVEGEENPELTVSYEGFKYEDDASVLTQQPTVTTEATTDSPAGTYPITVSGAEAANYDISYVAGTLTVEEAKIEPTDISQLDNAIYVDPVETVSNSTYALNIKAKNNVTVAGMSFTLTLPDDFSLITDDGGIISTLDSQRASSSKFMVMSSQSGNSYLIRVLPISGTTISGTDGTVLTVRLKNTNAEEGTYELKVNNSSFTVKNADNTFETLPLVDVISTIEITGNLLGDVNGDGNVDLTDAIMIVNHSLDNTPSNFRIDVADVNGDGNIDLTDAIIVVNMSMDSSSMARQAFMMDLDPE